MSFPHHVAKDKAVSHVLNAQRMYSCLERMRNDANARHAPSCKMHSMTTRSSLCKVLANWRALGLALHACRARSSWLRSAKLANRNAITLLAIAKRTKASSFCKVGLAQASARPFCATATRTVASSFFKVECAQASARPSCAPGGLETHGLDWCSRSSLPNK